MSAPATPVLSLASFGQVRSNVAEITARLFDFPEQDLVTAGRVLSVVTARAKAEADAVRG